ncbi:hypothetical protein B0T21DRAFT_101644 [Apiosordaria backusii]|uniref:Uncharacterized protein n=1 Tax=Apiosordaria backusii TaxID=314023 RepID=A0AA40K4A8_9PEZI|nr:hypothetical protein B0T21DRAFT_101644 [Apiosordaria backusii]
MCQLWGRWREASPGKPHHGMASRRRPLASFREAKVLEGKLLSRLCSSACQLDHQRFSPVLSKGENLNGAHVNRQPISHCWSFTCLKRSCGFFGGFNDDEKACFARLTLCFLQDIGLIKHSLPTDLLLGVSSCLCRACVFTHLADIALHSSLAQGPVKLYAPRKAKHAAPTRPSSGTNLYMTISSSFFLYFASRLSVPRKDGDRRTIFGCRKDPVSLERNDDRGGRGTQACDNTEADEMRIISL